ncbi:MAG: type II secretion system F family protein [Gammaproteobacteria bacterium]|nr:type II secretion system F family protein [Gammaproteobacteria bacterium]
MTQFRYKAVAPGGQVVQGEIEADSRDAAVAQLRDQGHLPISADPGIATWKWGLTPFGVRPRLISRGDIIALTRQLGTLLQAGLALDEALITLARVVQSPPLQRLIQEIQDSVQRGASLSEALAQHPRHFTALHVNLIRAGEAAGELPPVIDRLATYLEQSQELRSAVQTALIYPALLCVVALCSLAAIMVFVVPQFIPLFEDAGATLPLLTRLVFGAAGIARDAWLPLLAGLVVLGWIVKKRLEQPAPRLRWDLACLRLPLIGTVIREFETARFTRTLGILLGSGVPILTGIRLAGDVVRNRALAAVVEDMGASLEQGLPLTGPLRKSGLFPPLAVQLMEVGEESGQLDQMLLKTSEIYDGNVRIAIKRALALLEPVLILGLGGLIALIIMSVLVAILGLNELVV